MSVLQHSLHPPGSISSVSVWPSLNHKTARSFQRAEALFFLVGIFSQCSIFLQAQLKGGLLHLRGWISAWRVRNGGLADRCRHPFASVHLAILPSWDPQHQPDFLFLVRRIHNRSHRIHPLFDWGRGWLWLVLVFAPQTVQFDAKGT